MSDTRTFVRLLVRSDTVSPLQVTEIIGLEPDRVRIKGHLRPRTSLINKRHEWCRSSHLPESSTLEEHLAKLVADLADYELGLKSLSHCEIVISCAIYADSEPMVYFDAATVSAIARIGAAVDVDLYVSKGGGEREGS